MFDDAVLDLSLDSTAVIQIRVQNSTNTSELRLTSEIDSIISNLGLNSVIEIGLSDHI